MNRRRFLLITAAAATFSSSARAGITRWQADMLGGTVRVDLRGPRDLAQDVARQIGIAITEVEAAASLFRPDSALSRLNATGQLNDPPLPSSTCCALRARCTL
ncbi:FAD:protein FMN transferase [Ochrobactrum grignonense]|nr:FAD:protein FMN transferase [Brucella grignonensis]